MDLSQFSLALCTEREILSPVIWKDFPSSRRDFLRLYFGRKLIRSSCERRGSIEGKWLHSHRMTPWEKTMEGSCRKWGQTNINYFHLQQKFLPVFNQFLHLGCCSISMLQYFYVIGLLWLFHYLKYEKYRISIVYYTYFYIS